MRFITRRSVIAVLAVAGALSSLAALAQTPERGSQYDAQGRLVYSPSTGRVQYDDSQSRTAAAPSAKLAASPAGASVMLEAAGAPAAASASASFALEREWHRITFGESIGTAGIQVADVDADGQPEIVSGAWPAYGHVGNQAFYIVSRQADGYLQEWSSLPFSDAIRSIRVAQADGDPALEVLVGVGSRIEIWDGAARVRERTVTTGASEVVGLALADVDADGALELVFCDEQKLFVHDLATGALEFTGAGLGGQGLAVGQADADPALEIAVGGDYSAGLLVDGQTHAVEWSLPGGFGRHVRMGDLDGDGRAEVVAAFGWDTVAVYDTVTHAARYDVDVFDVAAVRLADVEGDGALELVYGDGQWGQIHVLDGATGSEKWRVANPEHGVTDIAIGDTDGDGVAEVVFGAGASSSGPDHLYVVDSVSRAIEWQSLDENGPYLGFTSGDTDADGAPELVYTSYSSDSGYDDGMYFVHDAVSKGLEFRSDPFVPANFNGVWRVRAANVDADPQLELVVTTGSGYSGQLVCFDGLTHDVQWATAMGASGLSFVGLQLVDLGGDGSLEAVVSVGKQHSGAPGNFVYVYDAATGALEWQSPALAGPSSWFGSSLLRVAQVDADPALEIVVASHGGALWIVDAATRAVEGSYTTLQVTALETADRDGDGRADVIVGTPAGKIQMVDAVTGAVTDIGSFGGAINGLTLVDVTGDGRADYVFGVADRLRVVDGASGGSLFVSDVLGSGVGAHDSLTAGDLDGDGKTEIAVNLGPFGLMVFEASFEPDTTPPVVSLTSPPAGPVSGTVLVQAQAIDDRGVAYVEFYLDGGFIGADATEPYSLSWNSATAAPGAHALSARAYDSAGNVGTSVDVVISVPDQLPPSVVLTEPAPGAVVSGTVNVAAAATDNVGVTRVDFYVDGLVRASDAAAPYVFAWVTTGYSNGNHTLQARAFDAAGYSAWSAHINVFVSNASAPGSAVYDPVLRAPRCSAIGNTCDSGMLLMGRGPLGPEPNQPNTLGGSCADGTAGVFHSDESNDRIEVSSVGGAPFATGRAVRVSATVWAWGGYSSDRLDIYSAADAANPVWTYRASITPTKAGQQVLSTTFNLPAGGNQVVRARFRYGSSVGSCAVGSFNDHDDLVFAVGPGVDPPPVVSITSPANGATVAGAVGVIAAASDDSSVLKVEFLVDGQVVSTDAGPPDWFAWWDTAPVPNGPHTLTARAWDAAGNVGESQPVVVNVQNAAGNAVYSATLRAPACLGVGSSCDSGLLLVGRGSVGPEPNQPNTINGSCADTAGGDFHDRESNDRIRVSTLDGTPLAAGKTVRVEATVWGWGGGGDYLDLYRATNAASPAWGLISTQKAKIGPHTLSATFTLPSGGLQAVRARFRYMGYANPCAVGGYADHDDLVFAVQP